MELLMLACDGSGSVFPLQAGLDELPKIDNICTPRTQEVLATATSIGLQQATGR
jgi:hypothetical protein